MSYSFTIRAATKQALKDKAAESITAQVANQPPHQRDIEAIRQTCNGFVDSLTEPGEGKEIVLECYGSISGVWENGAYSAYTNNSITCRVYHAPAATPA